MSEKVDFPYIIFHFSFAIELIEESDKQRLTDRK
jgi:hypothetical protein